MAFLAAFHCLLLRFVVKIFAGCRLSMCQKLASARKGPKILKKRKFHEKPFNTHLFATFYYDFNNEKSRER